MAMELEALGIMQEMRLTEGVAHLLWPGTLGQILNRDGRAATLSTVLTLPPQLNHNHQAGLIATAVLHLNPSQAVVHYFLAVVRDRQAELWHWSTHARVRRNPNGSHELLPTRGNIVQLDEAALAAVLSAKPGAGAEIARQASVNFRKAWLQHLGSYDWPKIK